MRGKDSARRAVAVILALSSLGPFAPPRAAYADATPDESKKPEALKHFQLGLDLVDRQAWDAALVEFLKSRELYPTFSATKNAAFCLKQLNRYDEALDMYEGEEGIWRQFP